MVFAVHFQFEIFIYDHTAAIWQSYIYIYWIIVYLSYMPFRYWKTFFLPNPSSFENLLQIQTLHLHPTKNIDRI